MKPKTLSLSRVVLVEGNYVLLDAEPWNELQKDGLLDDRIYVDTELDECMARVYRYGEGAMGNGVCVAFEQLV